MYGTGMGTLEVYVTDASGVPALAWSQFGDQGDQWNLAQVDLSSYTGDIVIQFVGTTGPDFILIWQLMMFVFKNLQLSVVLILQLQTMIQMLQMMTELVSLLDVHSRI